MEFVFGADPEVFVRKGTTPVSAFGFLEGTKENPLPCAAGSLQVDGMALEFNINPAKTCAEFIENIKMVGEQLRCYLPTKKHTFKLDPVAEFGAEYIAEQPDEAKELGCMPDYNAYTQEQNPAPNAEMPFRTSSGHLHVGWGNDMDPNNAVHVEACEMVAKQLDYSLGILTLFFGKRDLIAKRRELYGKAGSFRPKSYGMEYRTLDSYWLQSEEHIAFVYNIAKQSLIDLEDGYYYFDEHFAGVTNEELQRIINEADIEAAKKLVKSSPILRSYVMPKNTRMNKLETF